LTIDGTAIDGVRNEKISFASVLLLDSTFSVKAGQMTNENGKFQFQNVSVGEYYIKIHSIEYTDTIFSKINFSGDTILTFDVHKFCRYDSSINNKTCPICHKKDKVIPIIYGLLISTNGEDPMKDEGIKFKAGGCEKTNCDPNWYCKRDKLEF
jgi:hypothetical protein